MNGPRQSSRTDISTIQDIQSRSTIFTKRRLEVSLTFMLTVAAVRRYHCWRRLPITRLQIWTAHASRAHPRLRIGPPELSGTPFLKIFTVPINLLATQSIVISQIYGFTHRTGASSMRAQTQIS